MARILTDMCAGRGKEGDIATLEELGRAMVDTSLCALGSTAPNPVLSTIRHFRHEYEAHIRDRKCPAGVCREIITYSIDAQACTGCAVCAKQCPENAITGEPKKVHVLDVVRCNKCGVCYEVCKFNAIIRA